jgi:hypothetical protein
MPPFAFFRLTIVDIPLVKSVTETSGTASRRPLGGRVASNPASRSTRSIAEKWSAGESQPSGLADVHHSQVKGCASWRSSIRLSVPKTMAIRTPVILFVLVLRFLSSNHMLPSPRSAVRRVGKGGPDVSIDPQRPIRRAHQQRRGGHGGTRALLRGHASAAFAHPTDVADERRARSQ